MFFLVSVLACDQALVTDYEMEPSTLHVPDKLTVSPHLDSDVMNGHCVDSLPNPVPVQLFQDFDTQEDFDFDNDGYLCSIDLGNLCCQDQSGNTKIIATAVVPPYSHPAGTRMLDSEDWVVADTDSGVLVLVDSESGGTVPIVTGLRYPNGVDVDGNFVFVAENAGSQVRQIDVTTGEQWLVADGLKAPNGVILSPEKDVLYVGSFGGGVIYKISRLGETDWGSPNVLFRSPGPDGGFDGINVDICGNVYVTEYTVGQVHRISPDGSVTETVIDLPSPWIPNIRWGRGIGNWDVDVLYVTAWDRVYGLNLEIAGP